MFEALVIGAWVSLHKGCEITRDVGGSDAALLMLCGNGQPFELHCEAEPLRQLVEQGAMALFEMDSIAAQEEAEQKVSASQTAGCPA